MKKNNTDEGWRMYERANRMRSRFAQRIREFFMDELNICEEDAQAILDNAWKSVQAEFKEKKGKAE